MRWICTIAAMAVVVLTGCGGGSDEGTTGEPAQVARPVNTSRVNVTLDGNPGPENLGVLMANSRGYLKDAGLKVEVFTPESPYRPIEYVADGVTDIAMSHMPELVLAKERGLRIVAIGSVVPQTTAAMIWLNGSDIHGIDDLAGKTVAIPGLRFQRLMLQKMLQRAGLSLRDVDVVTAGYDLVPALVSGRADAIFGGSWNVEGAELEARGLDPAITRVQSLGVPPYEELVLVARSHWLAQNPRTARKFLAAMYRGVAAAREAPRAAAESLAAGASPKSVEGGVKATLPLLSTAGGMSVEQAERLAKWMREEGLIQREVPADTLLTNRFLEPSPRGP